MEPVENSTFDQTPIQSYSATPSSPKRTGKKIWIIILLVAIAVGAFLFLRPSGSNESETSATPSPTAFVEEPTIVEEVKTTTTPEPTAAEKVKTGPSIQVQNGSGTEGVAGKMQTALQDAGYDSVETGNADNFDYTGASIKAKDSALATAKKIITQLTDYTFDAEVATLSDDSDFDIIIIVGK